MPFSLNDKLVVGISSRALFDLDDANRVFDEQGLEAYRAFQRARENDPLVPGTGFPLVKALLAINDKVGDHLVEVVLVSRNDADSGLRIFNSIKLHKLNISRAAFVDGRDPFRYLPAFCCKLFLSAHEKDVVNALKARVPAALVYPFPESFEESSEEVRIAFDGDAVLFADESERYFQKHGLEAFQEREAQLADTPLDPGPFKPFLDAVSAIQHRFPDRGCPIRTALVTSRSAPAHKRPITTLRTWNVRVDESFFLGGLDKAAILRILKPHIFFDDQRAHLDTAAIEAPGALVPAENQSSNGGDAHPRVENKINNKRDRDGSFNPISRALSMVGRLSSRRRSGSAHRKD